MLRRACSLCSTASRTCRWSMALTPTRMARWTDGPTTSGYPTRRPISGRNWWNFTYIFLPRSDSETIPTRIRRRRFPWDQKESLITSTWARTATIAGRCTTSSSNRKTWPTEMKTLRNEKGFALLFVLILAAIALVMTLGMLLMVGRGSFVSGQQKRYRTAVEASRGGAEAMLQLMAYGGIPPYSNMLTDIANTSGNVMTKLSNPTT